MPAYHAYDLDAYELSIVMNQLTNIALHGESPPGMATGCTPEVHNPDNLNYDLFNQSEQIMTSSEQSNDVSQTETEITSDSNIIPYSQYLSETQQETVQNSNSSAQQDVLILSMFEQLSTQVTHCTNVNKALTTELDRYKGEVKDLKEMQNVENSFSGSNEQYAKIVRLKKTLFEQVQEKDSLMKTVSDLKNVLKKEENRNIDREIALEKKIKQLDNIIFKKGQSSQTIHRMTKSKICYDHSMKQAIGFEKPFYLKKVRESKPKLYDGNVILKMDNVVIPDSDETLMLCEEIRSKMLLKVQDPMVQTPSSNSKNKVEAHLRNVKSSLNKRNDTVKVKGSASVQNSKKHDNSDYVCINGDDCMSFDNLCISNSMNDVKFRAKSKKRKSKKEIWKPTGKVFTKMGYIWRPTGRTFTIVGNACPLTRITTTNEVPSRKPIVLESESPKPVVNLVYSRKPRKNKNTESVSKTKVVQIVLWYLDSGCSKHMTGDRSQLTNFISKFLGTVKFGNDQVAKIMGYGDYQIGNVTISRVYYVEGFGHNLFSVGQICDSNLEVAFRQHTCFIRNLEGVDLLTGSRGDNLYTLSLGNMMASSPICLLSKASKTKSWLWHRRLSHLNFGAINHLARHGLVRGLPKLKFEKDHLCSACALGKSSKKPHKPKSEDTNQEKLYLLHMDLCGPMRVASVNGKKYILVIVDDYSRFTWVKCLRSKDEAPAFIINFLKMIQVRLKETVRRIRTDNGTEFVNQTLREYYEKVGISHETSVARSPQQNGVVERRNHTLIEAARTMLIYAKAPLFLWAEAVATACYTQNHSMIRRRH
ncbi:retrovirus-related pol polyprotein from transposon TNT 1-94, partial [Tanacetum coccineum]